MLARATREAVLTKLADSTPSFLRAYQPPRLTPSNEFGQPWGYSAEKVYDNAAKQRSDTLLSSTPLAFHNLRRGIVHNAALSMASSAHNGEDRTRNTYGQPHEYSAEQAVGRRATGDIHNSVLQGAQFVQKHPAEATFTAGSMLTPAAGGTLLGRALYMGATSGLANYAGQKTDRAVHGVTNGYAGTTEPVHMDNVGASALAGGLGQAVVDLPAAHTVARAGGSIAAGIAGIARNEGKALAYRGRQLWNLPRDINGSLSGPNGGQPLSQPNSFMNSQNSYPRHPSHPGVRATDWIGAGVRRELEHDRLHPGVRHRLEGIGYNVASRSMGDLAQSGAAANTAVSYDSTPARAQQVAQVAHSAGPKTNPFGYLHDAMARYRVAPQGNTAAHVPVQ